MTFTQGSSCLATLGFGAQSLWDWYAERFDRIVIKSKRNLLDVRFAVAQAGECVACGKIAAALILELIIRRLAASRFASPRLDFLCFPRSIRHSPLCTLQAGIATETV